MGLGGLLCVRNQVAACRSLEQSHLPPDVLQDPPSAVAGPSGRQEPGGSGEAEDDHQALSFLVNTLKKCFQPSKTRGCPSELWLSLLPGLPVGGCLGAACPRPSEPVPMSGSSLLSTGRKGRESRAQPEGHAVRKMVYLVSLSCAPQPSLQGRFLMPGKHAFLNLPSGDFQTVLGVAGRVLVRRSSPFIFLQRAREEALCVPLVS